MNENINKYAELIINLGINIKKDDYLIIKSPTECDYFIEKLVEQAYVRGAKKVIVDFHFDTIKRHQFLNEEIENFEVLDDYIVSKNNYLVEKNFKFISISAPDPMALQGVDPAKVSAFTSAVNRQCRNMVMQTMNDISSWCVVSVPTKKWAEILYPDSSDAVDLLWTQILKATRCDLENPIFEWEKHIEKLKEVSKFLNDSAFDSLHFTNSIGTDINIGLPKNHIFMAAESTNSSKGHKFIANMPTEEVFSMPHKDKVDGRVYSSKPLNYNGTIIDEFYLEFKDGRVVEHFAKVGHEALTGLLDTDFGARSIGEVALVSYSSPINQSGILFFNTLYDENASCHLALGRAYPTTVLNGTDMSNEELASVGANDSAIHVDFMFGTKDMQVTGSNSNGDVKFFVDGEFIIKE